MREIRKIGIAGLGHIGRRHLEKYRALGLRAFTADPRVDAAEASAMGSAGHYGLLEEMLEREKPDAVSVCLPSPLHRESALASFAHGADVLVEKPFALTLRDIDDMLAAAARGRRIMAAHVCRFMAQYVMARETIESGRLGKPAFLNAWRNNSTPGWSAQNWLGDRNASGGTVMDLQIHEIDLAQWLLGPARDAALVQRQTPKFEGSGFLHAVSCLSFESGAAAVLEAGHLMPEGYPSASGYRLLFEEGELEFSQSGQDACMTLYEKGKSTDLTPEYEARRLDAFLEEIRHFISCLETGAEFAVSAAEARSAVETVLKIKDNEILAPA